MKHIIIGTAGHVDHGKTALIKAMTNIECDTHKQEKERGITINLGFAHLNLSSELSIGIVDMPGHKDFIDTMVSGASGIDLVLMVVAADSGIMPQTMEHLNILNVLGVKQGIIVITKSDLIDDELLELVTLEIEEKFEGSCLESADLIPVSAITGNGIDELVKLITAKSSEVVKRQSAHKFRMFPDRIFNVKGHGFVLTGSVLSGNLKKGDEVFLLPSTNKGYKVRGIQRHTAEVDNVVAGDRAAINLSGLKLEDFKRGMVLTDSDFEGTKLLDVNIELFAESKKLKRWSGAMFHSGTFQTPAKIHLLNCDELLPGETAIAQIHLENPGILLNKDRFVLRSGSGDKTIGGGIIFDDNPLHHRKRTKNLLESITVVSESLQSEDLLLSLINIELKKEKKIKTLSELAGNIGKSESDIKDFVKDNSAGFEFYETNGELIFISGDYESEIIQEVFSELDEYHMRNYLLPTGISSREFLSKLKLDKKFGPVYLDLIFRKLQEKGDLRLLANTWIKATHSVKLNEKTKDHLDWLENQIKNYGVRKPVYSEIESKAFERKIRKDQLMMFIGYLTREKLIYSFEKEFIHATLVNKVRDLMLSELIKKGRGINEGDFRLLFDGTKKIIHPLIGIFINEGIITREVNIINITPKGVEVGR